MPATAAPHQGPSDGSSRFRYSEPMHRSQFHLLRSRRFLPLFVTQFLGAANDNLFKNALVILILFRLADQAGMNGQIVVTAAAGLFILPFFIFSATAGQLADKFEKASMVKLTKLAEIAAMALGAWGFHVEDPWFLLTVLFLMGAQSAFFGPLKYGILPDHLRPEELIGGNALIEAGTFLAILLGTIAGGVLILAEHGSAIVSAAVLVLALLGFAASLFIPPARRAAPELVVDWNLFTETVAIVRTAATERQVFIAILGISWFWLVGATFLSQFPAFARDVLAADEQVVTLFLTVFSIGIGVGSMLIGRLLGGEISARHVPLAALGITLFSVDLYFAAHAAVPTAPGSLAGVPEFLSHAANWRILADLLLIAVAGGIYIVPLYAIMQAETAEEHRSRTVASNNVVNAAFMVAAAVITGGMLAAGLTVTDVFLWMAIANAGAAAYVRRLLPRATAR